MPATKFYPALSKILPLDAIPDELGVVKEGLNTIFSNFFYTDLQIHKSVNGEAAFYDLKIVSYKRLALEVPGTNGLALVLNPDEDPNTKLPVSARAIICKLKWRA